MLELRLVLPAALGFASSAVCSIGADSGRALPQRPPAPVFGVVWPVLYLLTGFAWTKSRKRLTNAMFVVLVALLTAWPVVFSCLEREKLAIFVLALVVGSTVGIMSIHESRGAAVALVPLLSWCLVALLLNWDIVGLGGSARGDGGGGARWGGGDGRMF
tara:strand:+ start:458 stop:934 length:477 start_codon:yes stop_codon:yes gene_type:complete